MNRINVVRVIAGGVVAGVVLFFMMGFLHGKILAADWNAFKPTMTLLNHGQTDQAAMKLWFLMSLVVGITGTWLYAGIRPRYGAGPVTALRAGLMTWLLTYLTAGINAMALGIFPDRITKVSVVGELVASLVCIFIGAAIYKE